jgi:DNA polymerase-3 subunit delta
MKLEAWRIEAFLADPGAVARGALLYGDDDGLVRERGARLVRAVAGGADDPFRVVELERDGYDRTAAEMASLPMTGGRRVVRLREAGDAATASVQAALAGDGPGFLVIEAPGLPARSKLRALAEANPALAAIACYRPEARALGQMIRATLEAAGVAVDADTLLWLEGRLGADRGVTETELQKLATYAGPKGRVDLAAARLCVGDLAGLSLDDALFAATAGDAAAADRALELAMAEGAEPVTVLRSALMHVERLHRAGLAVAAGSSPAEATKAVKPPVFYRREPAFRRALEVWPARALEAAAGRLWEAERSCKRTGAPAETICRSAILGLAQQGKARALPSTRQRP